MFVSAYLIILGLFNPLKTAVLNNIHKFSSYLERNTLRLRYKGQAANAV
jgi:hypothetical protein